MASLLDDYRVDFGNWDPDLASGCSDRDLLERLAHEDREFVPGKLGPTNVVSFEAVNLVKGNTRDEMLKSVQALLASPEHSLTIRQRTDDLEPPDLSEPLHTPSSDLIYGTGLRIQLETVLAVLEDRQLPGAQEAALRPEDVKGRDTAAA